MPSYLFWLFSTLMLIGGVSVILFRNPVSSALSVVTCFIGLAGLFIGLSAFFLGVIQILVYTGAVMVLFLFIIMLLDLKHEEKSTSSILYNLSCIALVVAFVFQLIAVISTSTNQQIPSLEPQFLKQAASKFSEQSVIHQKLMSGRLPDVHLIGQKLFTEYNLPLQILGVLLLVATIGVVVLSKKQTEQ
jgi:NADH-quinone oxidoreductase subunit J